MELTMRDIPHIYLALNIHTCCATITAPFPENFVPKGNPVI